KNNINNEEKDNNEQERNDNKNMNNKEDGEVASVKSTADQPEDHDEDAEIDQDEIEQRLRRKKRAKQEDEGGFLEGRDDEDDDTEKARIRDKEKRKSSHLSMEDKDDTFIDQKGDTIEEGDGQQTSKGSKGSKTGGTATSKGSKTAGTDGEERERSRKEEKEYRYADDKDESDDIKIDLQEEDSDKEDMGGYILEDMSEEEEEEELRVLMLALTAIACASTQDENRQRFTGRAKLHRAVLPFIHISCGCIYGLETRRELVGERVGVYHTLLHPSVPNNSTSSSSGSSHASGASEKTNFQSGQTRAPHCLSFAKRSSVLQVVAGAFHALGCISWNLDDVREELLRNDDLLTHVRWAIENYVCNSSNAREDERFLADCTAIEEYEILRERMDKRHRGKKKEQGDEGSDPFQDDGDTNKQSENIMSQIQHQILPSQTTSLSSTSQSQQSPNWNHIHNHGLFYKHGCGALVERALLLLEGLIRNGGGLISVVLKTQNLLRRTVVLAGAQAAWGLVEREQRGQTRYLNSSQRKIKSSILNTVGSKEDRIKDRRSGRGRSAGRTLAIDPRSMHRNLLRKDRSRPHTRGLYVGSEEAEALVGAEEETLANVRMGSLCVLATIQHYGNLIERRILLGGKMGYVEALPFLLIPDSQRGGMMRMMTLRRQESGIRRKGRAHIS
ncbi:MAG: hypothetical protein EZS28_038940, partial [Streblomastix strix]